jgi:hypothetical protein
MGKSRAVVARAVAELMLRKDSSFMFILNNVLEAPASARCSLMACSIAPDVATLEIPPSSGRNYVRSVGELCPVGVIISGVKGGLVSIGYSLS